MTTGASISAAERLRAVENLRSSVAAIEARVAGLAGSQWSYRATPDAWSIAECLEHLAVTEEHFLGQVERALAGTPLPEGARDSRDAAARRDDTFDRLVRNRTRAVLAPEFSRPLGRHTGADGLEAFRAARARTLAFAETTTADLRGHTAPHPFFGEIDGYQWLLVMAAHSARHGAQIEELLADPRFPARG